MQSIRQVAVTLLFTTVFSSAALVSDALAAPDAAAVQKNLQAYLGSEPGVVTVAPEGDDLKITLDVMPYVTKAAIPNAKFSMVPVTMTAHANGDGTWDIKSSAPFNVDLTSPDLSFGYKAEKFDWTGTFDEELRGFTKSHAEMSNVSLDETVSDPNNGVKTKIAYAIAKYAGDTVATKRDAGVADLVSTIAAEDVKGTWSADPASPAMAGGTFSTAKVGVQGTITGLHQRAVMDLLAWLVSHPAKDLIIKDQADLKKSLTAALPFFEAANVSENFDGLNFQTPLGNVTAQSAKVGIDMAGLTKAGRFGESLEVAGLGIPPGLAPPWATDLVPTAATFGFSASGFDADTPARIFIEKMDLSKPEPVAPDVNMALAAAALPSGSLTISLPTTTITAPAYAISMTGDMQVSPAGPSGSGKLDIKMKGLDAVMAKLQEAGKTDPQAAQAMAGIIAAKGMAKTEADGTSTWAIVYTPEGKVTVNGLDMGALGGAPPAQ